MDWNQKAPSWDFTELEQETISNLESVNGSSSFGNYRSSRDDFSVDLKLGQVGNSSNELVDSWKEQGIPKTTSFPSGSSKRSRGSYNGSQVVSCLVDGCSADLSSCRDYNKRHKVCELHSKAPQVTIGGQKQRFCQQCSRFHSLEEFDEGKRSCRKRLDGHNRRRRKPQPDPFSRFGTLLPNYHQGTQLLPFSSSLVYPSTTVVNPSWAAAGVVKPEEDHHHLGLHHQHQQLPFLDKHDTFLGSSYSSTSSYNGRYNNNKQFSPLQIHSQATTQVSSCSLPLLGRSFPMADTGVARSKVFCESFVTTTTTQIHSDCALSLLSSPQNISQLNSIPLAQPLGPLSLHGNGGNLEPIDSVLVAPAGMSQLGSANHHGSQANEAPQTLPSNWDLS
ncbi:hypothetical protein UlMin_007661 [Ulmus minor]